MFICVSFRCGSIIFPFIVILNLCNASTNSSLRSDFYTKKFMNVWPSAGAYIFAVSNNDRYELRGIDWTDFFSIVALMIMSAWQRAEEERSQGICTSCKQRKKGQVVWIRWNRLRTNNLVTLEETRPWLAGHMGIL